METFIVMTNLCSAKPIPQQLLEDIRGCSYPSHAAFIDTIRSFGKYEYELISLPAFMEGVNADKLSSYENLISYVSIGNENALSDYEMGVRDTMFRIAGQIDCADNGNEITADVDYFLTPYKFKLSRSAKVCWEGLKMQIMNICRGEDFE